MLFRELKIANEWFNECPRNKLSYRWAENVERVLLQTTDEHLRKFWSVDKDKVHVSTWYIVIEL